MNKDIKTDSGASALELEVVNIDLNRITDEDLELIYGKPAKEVRRMVAQDEILDAIEEDLQNMSLRSK